MNQSYLSSYAPILIHLLAAAGLAGGLLLVNWLVGDDNLITVQPRSAADDSIDIDQTGLYLIAFSFLFVLPLAFMLTGAVIWWRRRRI